MVGPYHPGTLGPMGTWYWIGVLAGVGVALGIAAAGVLLRWPLAALLAVVVAAAIGIAVFAWGEAVAGAVGGVAGAFGASPVVNGALRRGGTRLGLAVFVLLGALAAVALAFIPIIGFIEAIASPVVGSRLRRRTPERHAGLRTLARD
jgi:hypothetical protein